jgi:hypothetical protein
MWLTAYQNRTIAIDFPEDSTDQSLKRFRRIRAGDRVVAYVQGGTIGSIGVVTRAYHSDEPPSGSAAALFSGGYRQRLQVAWADTPDEPVVLLAELKQPEHTPLYNRLKNPQTVAPLTRADYIELLTLLHVDDVGTPPSETRLPAAWLNLSIYRDFAQRLGDQPISAATLASAARAHDSSLNSTIDLDGLIEDLRRLRLVRSVGDDQYAPWAYTRGDRQALLGLMTLALLIPVEGSADTYMLPARSIVPRLRSAPPSQPNATFAPALGNDQYRLLAWYREAGFVQLDEASGTWSPVAHALTSRTGDDPATIAYNAFLQTLLAEIDQTLPSDLAPATGPLPPGRDLADCMLTLGRDLLIEDHIVRRIYRSLMAGRNVILSGPPGTGKTELATRLPSLLWSEPEQRFTRLTDRLDQPPAETTHERRNGYATLTVTATEDWGVRDVVGGIAPQLDGDKHLTYTIQYGALTRAVLQHYEGTDQGRRLPQANSPKRSDYRDEWQNRYRGIWLVIDEFTRAPVDAAFGSLLTTLSGGDSAILSVPAPDGTNRDITIPADFRIIGTLNSFDRHFLNQMSEAIKRRFDFIDIPPPAPRRYAEEQALAAVRALRRLHAQGFSQISIIGDPPVYQWDGLTAAPNEMAGTHGYQLKLEDTSEASSALHSLWNIFAAVRVFRQLGTAQLVALHTNLFAGVLIGMRWNEALDTALADSLADQLQVLTNDEQRLVQAYIECSGNALQFLGAVQAIVDDLSPGRRSTIRRMVRDAEYALQGNRTITLDEVPLTNTQIGRVFSLKEPLALPKDSIFQRRLSDLIGERGL